MARNMIPLSGADIGPAEKAAVIRVLGSGRLSLGPWALKFEELVAEYVGVKHAVAVSSGTTGLHLVVRALGLKPGDEVITTSFSFVASVNCLVYEGVKPVFADINPATLCLDPGQVEEAITPRTRAILAVDVFGQPADWPALESIARQHGLALIEDSCEALGSSLGPRRCGSFGHAAVFAFYPNKQITTGEGGMIVTRDRRIADLCRSMANQGRAWADPHAPGCWLEHVRLGYNYRMNELAAALGCAQMRRIDRILARRRLVARRYNRLLTRVPGVCPVLPDSSLVAHRSSLQISPFVYCVRLAPGILRTRVMAGLREQGIACADYFRPIHLQPYFRKTVPGPVPSLPVTEAAGRELVALPFFTRLSGTDQKRVVRALSRAIENATGRSPRRNHHAAR